MTSRYTGLVIYGCGGHARSVVDVALFSGVEEFIFVDPAAKPNETCFGFAVQKASLKTLPTNWGEFCAHGDNNKRQAYLEQHQSLVTIISTSATVGNEALVSRGCFIGHHAHIGPLTQIGVGCIINTGAVVEHNCVIGDYAHVSVNATLCGKVSLGARCFIGAGATVIDGIAICADVTVGAGSVVIDAIEQPGTYVGVPARRVNS